MTGGWGQSAYRSFSFQLNSIMQIAHRRLDVQVISHSADESTIEGRLQDCVLTKYASSTCRVLLKGLAGNPTLKGVICLVREVTISFIFFWSSSDSVTVHAGKSSRLVHRARQHDESFFQSEWL
jgi:hypothetical protein